MTDVEVIIVGGGPAGATCAWKLKQAGLDCIVLDRRPFPRPKVCAGWITPRVIEDLELDLDTYPHSLETYRKIHYHLRGVTIGLRTLQYAIRRIEFDHWLLERSGVEVIRHRVERIERAGRMYVVDGRYRCRYLVGAAGTHCPVYTTLFKEINPRAEERLISAMEAEFEWARRDGRCHLWFFEHGLAGYAWYLSKGNGFVNVGLGGLFHRLKGRDRSLRSHWDHFVQKLETLSLVSGAAIEPKGHTYYVRGDVRNVRLENAFIAGDAAGLATRDMGEGIGPAVQSGIRCAAAIVGGDAYSLRSVPRFSIPRMIAAGIRR